MLYYNIGKKSQRKWTVKRGEVYFADLGENIGSEENKILDFPYNIGV